MSPFFASFFCRRGAASLLNCLSAPANHRSVQLNYANLVGAYLLAAAQLSLAVGREVLQ